MSEHYYQQTPSVLSNEQEHIIHVANIQLKCVTDSGVFSKTGLDFGSRTLIEALKDQTYADGAVLDVGCGYGPIGLSLAKLNPSRHIDMVDINERAVALSHKNSQLNGITNTTVFQSDTYSNINKKDYALIVSNPPIRAGKSVVHHIISESIQYLQKDGVLVIVIQKKQGALSAEKKMQEVFGNVQLIARKKGYWILQSIKEHN